MDGGGGSGDIGKDWFGWGGGNPEHEDFKKIRNEQMRQERERKAAEEEAARERELAPLKKALRDEVDFLGKKYSTTSKIGGRGIF